MVAVEISEYWKNEWRPNNFAHLDGIEYFCKEYEEYIANNPGANITIEVHGWASNTGGSLYNRELSRRRAFEVVCLLRDRIRTPSNGYKIVSRGADESACRAKCPKDDPNCDLCEDPYFRKVDIVAIDAATGSKEKKQPHKRTGVFDVKCCSLNIKGISDVLFEDLLSTSGIDNMLNNKNIPRYLKIFLEQVVTSSKEKFIRYLLSKLPMALRIVNKYASGLISTISKYIYLELVVVKATYEFREVLPQNASNRPQTAKFEFNGIGFRVKKPMFSAEDVIGSLPSWLPVLFKDSVNGWVKSVISEMLGTSSLSSQGYGDEIRISYGRKSGANNKFVVIPVSLDRFQGSVAIGTDLLTERAFGRSVLGLDWRSARITQVPFYAFSCGNYCPISSKTIFLPLGCSNGMEVFFNAEGTFKRNDGAICSPCR